jgi:S-DNA-T family DNA segregation ATPase FtsK/SpoIIIE
MAQKQSSGNYRNRRQTAARPKGTRGGTTSRRRGSGSRSGGSSRRQRRPFKLDVQQKALIIGLVLLFSNLLVLLSFITPNRGEIPTLVTGLMGSAFGWGGVIAPLGLGAIGFYLILWGMDQEPQLPIYRTLGLVLLFLTFEAFASLFQIRPDRGFTDVWAVAQARSGGGYLGGVLVAAFVELAGSLGAIFVFLVVGIIATILVSGVSRADFAQFVTSLMSRGEAEAVAPPAEREIPVTNGRPVRLLPSPDAGPPVRPLGSTPAREPIRATPALPPKGPTAAAQAKEAVAKNRRQGDGAAAPALPIAPTPITLGQAGGPAWHLPKVADLLESGSDGEVNNNAIREQVEVIEHTLDSFGAPATVVEISQGPTITQYGVEPNFVELRNGKRTKVKVGKIASLADDLALALAARSIRIQAPVPGKGYVGIEVPNTAKALVSLRDVMEAAEFRKIRSSLAIGLGQNVAGQPIAADLAAMPHLLIAGTTGSGKSVCVNAIIACLLLQNTPDDLKMVMVDPKRVELTGYNGIPHLVAPVVVDLERVVGTLQWAMREMDGRYQRFSEMGARNIADHNAKAETKGEQRLPHIVIVIDELADLMMLSPEDTERGITRLAQMARATGIHMVIATQRPSVDVVTGLIKANFPARIAFAVASGTDSRVILDTTGAERLLGQGDMLFQSPDAAAPVRMQGCFVSDRELTRIIDYWRTARRFNVYRPDSPSVPVTPAETADEVEGQATVAPPEVKITPQPPAKPVPAPIVQPPLWEEMREAEQQAKEADELLPEAIELVRKLGKASTSLLQRRFRIGYTRAARLIDLMEEERVIGPPTGTSKAREVFGATASAEDGATEEAENGDGDGTDSGGDD